MFHGFAFFASGLCCEVAVDGVDDAVGPLNDGGIVVGSGVEFFEVSRRFPSGPFVFRDRDGEVVTSLGLIVVDQGPVSVGKDDAVDSRAGVGEFRGGDFAPVDSVVLGFADADFSSPSIFPHVGDDGSILAAHQCGLDVPEADEGFAGVPVASIIIADGHQAERIGVGIEREQNSSGGEKDRLTADHPAEALKEFVLDADFGGFDVLHLPFGQLILEFRGEFIESLDGVFAEVVGLEVEYAAAGPVGISGTVIVGAVEIIREGRFPVVIEDDGPEEPQLLMAVEIEGCIAIGKPGVVGHEKVGGPLLAPLGESCAVDGDVVGLAFSVATIPGGEEFAVGEFDDAGGVIVVLAEGENEFGLQEVFGGDGADENGSENQRENAEDGMTRHGTRTPTSPEGPNQIRELFEDHILAGGGVNVHLEEDRGSEWG